MFVCKDDNPLIFVDVSERKDGKVWGRSGYWMPTQCKRDFCAQYVDQSEKFWLQDWHTWGPIKTEEVREALCLKSVMM